MTDTLLTRDQLAARFHVKKETIIIWELAGRLKPVKISPHVILHYQADVEAFEAAQKAAK